jgi:rare lipoprotein A
MRQTFYAFSALFAAILLSSFVFQKEEIGKAGYYADSFHGRKTSSGELYDKYAFTCAHKTLAFGTKVKVTRLDNNRSVVVRVNDRGPSVEGYVVDLSRAAAEEIDLIKIGVTRVKVEIVEEVTANRVGAESDGNQALLSQKPNNKPTNSTEYSKSNEPASLKAVSGGEKTTTELFAIEMHSIQKTGFGVQVSTLYNPDNVLPTVKKLQQDWPSKVMVSLERDEAYNKSTYRIILGPYIDNKTAAVQQKAAAKKGYKGCFIVNLGGM